MRRDWSELEHGRIECALLDLQPVEIQLVEGEAEYTLWEQLVSRHHYLGYRRYYGRQLRYLISGRRRVIGAIGWKSGSLKLERLQRAGIVLSAGLGSSASST